MNKPKCYGDPDDGTICKDCSLYAQCSLINIRSDVHLLPSVYPSPNPALPCGAVGRVNDYKKED